MVWLFFQKLYLETRSQYNHYLEFTLWVERENTSDGSVSCYDRVTYAPVHGTNTFKTEDFIPKTGSAQSSVGSSDEKEENSTIPAMKFIKMVPQSGKGGDTTYLTFHWPSRDKDQGGEIFVVWNDEILHLPYFGKDHHEKVVVVEHIPEGPSGGNVPIYLKEKPPQGSSNVGVTSNVLLFHYQPSPLHHPILLPMHNQLTELYSSSEGCNGHSGTNPSSVNGSVDGQSGSCHDLKTELGEKEETYEFPWENGNLFHFEEQYMEEMMDTVLL